VTATRLVSQMMIAAAKIPSRMRCGSGLQRLLRDRLQQMA
jgi:hypothetical protein